MPDKKKSKMSPMLVPTKWWGSWMRLMLILGVVGIVCGSLQAQFRVKPYLVCPTSEAVRITWFTETQREGHLFAKHAKLEKLLRYRSAPFEVKALQYSALEEKERKAYPDMFENANYKHQVVIRDLLPGVLYAYTVIQGEERFNGYFRAPPSRDWAEPIRFMVLADAETDPDGRNEAIPWGDIPDIAYVRAAEGDSRPPGLAKDQHGRELYLATQQVGLARNLKVIEERKPDLILMPGDLVQGGGYQRAWDEYFRHFSGRLSSLLGKVPLLPALGNWENTGARNGKYAPEAVFAARQKFKAYFDAPPNNNPDYQDLYYRVDYGPVTILTMDTSNGLPDNTDNDTQKNVSAATYPGRDLPDFNEGSDQWLWMMSQLEDASRAGQVIFVQFHHPPFTSGRHGYRFTSSAPRRDGQSGYPLRKYAPHFERYGVTAVFSGHSELFERSLYNGIHYYDVGVAGDGLRSPEPSPYARENNPYRAWAAHYDEPELWQGGRLIKGGKHYGHLEVNVTRKADDLFQVELSPVHIFPLMDSELKVKGWERRVYNDVIVEEVDVSKRRGKS